MQLLPRLALNGSGIAFQCFNVFAEQFVLLLQLIHIFGQDLEFSALIAVGYRSVRAQDHMEEDPDSQYSREPRCKFAPPVENALNSGLIFLGCIQHELSGAANMLPRIRKSDGAKSRLQIWRFVLHLTPGAKAPL